MFVEVKYRGRNLVQKRIVFPFSAIVNLDKLKLAILINAINPKIGGILIRGPKGSGKTTIARALADILPKIKVVKGCPFNCNPYDPSNMCPKCFERYKKGEKLPVEEREMVVVDLPLGATEDRVVGSLDVEKAIKYGIEALEPGILAEANQNILYVDEINLLPDHIADDLLDAAATGWNVVEREGVSVRHPSRFIFIGTMNPEEGELRPQLLDRFPLSVTVGRISSVEERMEIVRRNLEFEKNPEAFIKKFEPYQRELKKRIIQARKILPKVKLNEALLEAICKACLELKVDGVRPDIVISKAACTLAAFENRIEVTMDDILVAAELALSHRTREGGFLEPATPEEIKDVFLGKIKEAQLIIEKKKGGKKSSEGKEDKLFGRSVFWIKGKTSEKEQKMAEKRSKSRFWRNFLKLSFILNRIFGGTFGIAKKARRKIEGLPSTSNSIWKGKENLETETEKVKISKSVKAIPAVKIASQGKAPIREGKPLLSKIRESIIPQFRFSFKVKGASRKIARYAGKRAEAVTSIHRGRIYGWKFPKDRPRDIHLPATIRVAARRKMSERRESKLALEIAMKDVREKLRIYRAPVTVVFVIDLSGSMLFNIEAVKEAILRLHRDAYRNRDKVGIVALKGVNAVVVQHPIRNLRVVANKLLSLRVSGYTPLAAGMLKALEVLKSERKRDPSTIPVMVLVTDGCANVPLVRSLESGEVRKFDEVSIIVRELEDLAVHDVFYVSKIVKKEGVNTIIVNTNPHVYGRETYGFLVTEEIARITNGSLHTVGRIRSKEEFVNEVMEKIAEERGRITYASSKVMMESFD
ncbi:VWA domain-containing protein [Candidatus Bathyarchaeota archaeon]|nr:VWA domain-containing protein [Candidatus Bathyarchaeota archaeon]